MSTVRVTCPECEFAFNVAESRVGGLVACRDCQAEFRVEFAEDEKPPAEEKPPALEERPASPAPRTRSRVDADHEPDAWKTDLPIRSPVPLLLILAGLQVLAAGFLVVNWFFPVQSTFSTPSTAAYYSTYPTAPNATGNPRK